MNAPFWKSKTLAEMDASEWESLCDGCGKCCLHKLEDEDSGEVFFTAVACRLLDLEAVRCMDYRHRSQEVPECLQLNPDNLQAAHLPRSCAYRCLAEGRELPDWHPLVSGDSTTVPGSGHSVRGRVVAESEAGDPEHYLVDWY